MKAPFSPYLTGIAEPLKALIARLGERYDYVSALATDSVGFAVRISQRAKSVGSDTMMTERGVVVRVRRNGQYAEAAFNDFDPADMDRVCADITAQLEAQAAVLAAAGVAAYETAALPDEPQSLLVEMETGRLPE